MGGGGLICSQNCLFISRSYDFISLNCKSKSCNYEKKSNNCDIKKLQLPLKMYVFLCLHYVMFVKSKYVFSIGLYCKMSFTVIKVGFSASLLFIMILQKPL